MERRETARAPAHSKPMDQQNVPMVGVGVMIVRDGRVLLTKRKGSHGEGEYSFPGGHLEYMESFEQCARRETLEECGVEISNVRFQFLSNVTAYAPKHYVHIGLIADWAANEPQLLEPQKAEGWDWYSLDALPRPMFKMCRLSFDSYRENRNYYDLE